MHTDQEFPTAVPEVAVGDICALLSPTAPRGCVIAATSERIYVCQRRFLKSLEAVEVIDRAGVLGVLTHEERRDIEALENLADQLTDDAADLLGSTAAAAA